MPKQKKTAIKSWRVARLHAKGLTPQAIADKIGASYMGIRLALIRLKLLHKPLPPSRRK